MYLGDKANEQATVILKSAEAAMRRVMDVAIENDCATIMYEAQRIAGDIAVLRTALLDRDDLVSITDIFDCFGDPTDKSVEELEEEELDDIIKNQKTLEETLKDMEDLGPCEDCPFGDEYDDDEYEDLDLSETLSIIGSSLGEILDILKSDKKEASKPKSNSKSVKSKDTNKEDNKIK